MYDRGSNVTIDSITGVLDGFVKPVAARIALDRRWNGRGESAHALTLKKEVNE